MTRRNTELLLLCLAAPFVILLFSMVLVKQDTALSFETLAVPLGLFGAFIVAHIATRFFAKNADPAIMPIVFGLSGIGIAFVTRLAPDLAIRQVMWLFLGIVLMVATLAIVRNLDKLARYKYTFMIVGIVLLLMPMLPGIGQEVLGSRIWIKIGGFSFQPGEIAKVCIVIFLASYLAQNREMLSVFTVRVGRFYLPDAATLGPLLVMWGISFSIAVFEKDLGSALVFFVGYLVMVYVATKNPGYLGLGLLGGSVASVAAYYLFGHVRQRVVAWKDPMSVYDQEGYQIVQSLFAIGTGGWFGMGLCQGASKGVLPVVEEDFVFAAICEELGILFAICLILVCMSFFLMVVNISLQIKNNFYKLIALGLGTEYAFQVFLTIGGATKFIPMTGITLPLVSYGGSSAMSTIIMLAIIQGLYILREDEDEEIEEKRQKRQPQAGRFPTERESRISRYPRYPG